MTLAAENASEREMAQRLRTGTPPVVGRLERGRVIIDLRAVLPQQDEDLIDALVAGLQAVRVIRPVLIPVLLPRVR